MSSQVIVPLGVLDALLSDSPVGDACLRLLGIETSGVAWAAAGLLGSTPEVTDEATEVLTDARSVIGSCDRCVMLTAETGALRVGWVFESGGRGAELAISPAGLHVSATGAEETRTVLQTWLGGSAGDSRRVFLLGPDGVEQSFLVAVENDASGRAL